MRSLVAGAKKVRRTKGQRVSAWPGGRALLWLVVLLLLVVVVGGIWVLAMVLL